MIRPLTVLSSWPRLIVQVVCQAGLDEQAFLSQTGLDPTLLTDPNAQVSTLEVIRLWQAAIDLLGDDLPLRLARAVNAGTFHALGFAMATSATGYDALARLAQYYPMITSSIQLKLIEQGDFVRIRLESSELTQTLRNQFAVEALALSVAQLREAGALALLSLCRSFFGVSFTAEQIVLNRQLGALYPAYQEHVQCELIDGADRVEVSFRKEQLDRPLPSANPHLSELHDRIIESYLAMLKDDVSTRVVSAIIRQLPRGNTTQDTVAKALNLSSRTLQRKLADRGLSFRELLVSTRKELALQYLRQNHIPVLEVGYQLGFSEPANFSRAFKQWTGEPPGQYRERWQQAHPSTEDSSKQGD
ncbi:AraC family transcriptional regulator [Reinekea blandensis]|uniref:Transcriptional regulator, AraC family protein n=1 Tax=Reinekea blandensis MED297 TaxID=314283 RepID=A4BF80_9GAMM|nr:AraC family transcriptional regulator [Reinekea blandensis]EAR09193.1 transcriptional regulator, AraC family protein [Reinekea sp. MED297] [Reinekea blandensis MED297]